MSEQTKAQLQEDLEAERKIKDELLARLEVLEQKFNQLGLADDSTAKIRVEPIQVDRHLLNSEQVEQIKTYDVYWLSPRPERYVQPVVVEGFSKTKAVARWRERLGFAPESIAGVRVVEQEPDRVEQPVAAASN